MIIAIDENGIKSDDKELLKEIEAETEKHKNDTETEEEKKAREEFYKIEAKFKPSEAEKEKELEKHLERISANSLFVLPLFIICSFISSLFSSFCQVSYFAILSPPLFYLLISHKYLYITILL